MLYLNSTRDLDLYDYSVTLISNDKVVNHFQIMKTRRKSKKEAVGYRGIRRKHEEEYCKTGGGKLGKDFVVKIKPCILY